VLVDNASNDASIAAIERKGKAKRDVIIVKNNYNMGFAEGNNVGARHAAGNLLVFISNDTEVPANWLDDLVATAMSDPVAGIVLPRVISQASPEGDLVGNIDWLGNGVLVDMQAFQASRAHFRPGAREVYRRDSDFETIAAGPAFMIKRMVWDQIGGFDPKYFIYAEDIDLSWRARLVGYRTIVSKGSFVRHRIAGTTRKMGLSERRYLTYRNTLRTLIKDYSTASLLKVIAPFFVIRIGETLALLFSARNPKIVASIVRATGWNIRHFSDSWSLHVLIQAKRTISEREVRGVMARLSITGLGSIPVPLEHRSHLDSRAH
jgi:GT2 family glycosyltransferase